ncbi:MAG: WD40 repeat domain-containing protein [Prochlorothrix sp.]
MLRGTEGDLAAIYEKLRRNAAANRVTILVFDQFEEFFTSAGVTQEQREAFYEFVVECLRGTDVQFVKVVLSLREDYCDRLRELDRFVRGHRLETALFDERNAYYLGNFTKQRAQTVIEALSGRANYEMEPQLVKALVNDLATEGGLVRPVQLQVVGAQLQGSQIRTVAAYEDYIGGKVTSILSSTAPVVDGYINEVVADCGEAREREAAWGILLGLTNAQGLRPIRSEADVELAVACFGVARGDATVEEADLELVQRVLTESGLVVTWGEGEQRFQLVHDYLVYPIRDQFPDYDFEQQLKLRDAKQREHVLTQENKLLAMAGRKATRRLTLATVVSGVVVLGAVTYAGNRLDSAQQREVTALSREETALDREKAAQQELIAVNAEISRVQVESQQLEAQTQREMAQVNQDKAKAEEAVAAAQGQLGQVQAEAAQVQAEAEASLATARERAAVAQGEAEEAQRAWGVARQSLDIAQKATALERLGVAAQKRFEFQQTEGLWVALKAGVGLKQLKAQAPPGWTDYPASPLLALQTGLEQIRETRFEGHQGRVLSVQFSPQGDQIVTRGEDGTARLWDLNGNQTAQYEGWGVFNDDWTRLALIQDPKPWIRPQPPGQVVTLWEVRDLDGLIARTCIRLRPFLLQSSTVSNEDRALCNLPPHAN